MEASSPNRAATSTVVAFLLAPLVASVGVSLVGSLAAGVPQFTVVDIVGWALILYVYAACAAMVLGLPSYFVLLKLGAIRWWSTALVGCLVGLVVFVVVNANGLAGLATQTRLASSWGIIGALAAITFWVIWRWGHREGSNHEA